WINLMISSLASSTTQEKLPTSQTVFLTRTKTTPFPNKLSFCKTAQIHSLQTISSEPMHCEEENQPHAPKKRHPLLPLPHQTSNRRAARQRVPEKKVQPNQREVPARPTPPS